MKKISKDQEQEYDLLTEDADLWDSKQLGADPKHAKPAPQFARKSVTTTIRLSAKLLDDLKKRAEDEGMPYQTLIKHVLTKYLRGA